MADKEIAHLPEKNTADPKGKKLLTLNEFFELQEKKYNTQKDKLLKNVEEFSKGISEEYNKKDSGLETDVTPDQLSKLFNDTSQANHDIKNQLGTHTVLSWVLISGLALTLFGLAYQSFFLLPGYKEDYVKSTETQNTQIELLRKDNEKISSDNEDLKKEVFYLRNRFDKYIDEESQKKEIK